MNQASRKRAHRARSAWLALGISSAASTFTGACSDPFESCAERRSCPPGGAAGVSGLAGAPSAGEGGVPDRSEDGGAGGAAGRRGTATGGEAAQGDAGETSLGGVPNEGGGGVAEAGTSGSPTAERGGAGAGTSAGGAQPAQGGTPSASGGTPIGQGGAVAQGGAATGLGGAPAQGGTVAQGGGVAIGTGGATTTGPASCSGLSGTECSGGNCCASSKVIGGTFQQGGAFASTVSTFMLDKYEVTVGRFRRFVGGYNAWRSAGNPRAGAGANANVPMSGWDSSWSLPANDAELKTSFDCENMTWADSGNDALPMNCVNWFVAFAFCAWDGGRLPTEAEWEYAAAGGVNGFDYPWGDTPVPDNTGNASAYAVYKCFGDGTSGCTFADIQPVGSRPLGQALFGQYDLAGSVDEWVLDWNAPYPTTAATNYAKIDTGTARGTRGGNWSQFAGRLLANSRGFYWPPTARSQNTGFRCARPA